MSESSPIINILTYGLPFKLANQIYNEYDARAREAIYIINNTDFYKPLSEYVDTVKLLLALTIFHKRVIANLNAAIKFHDTVSKYSDAQTITIGTYAFTGGEKDKILGLIISYNSLRERFGIPDNLHEYEATRELLKKLLSLMPYSKHEQKENKSGFSEDEDDLPF